MTTTMKLDRGKWLLVAAMSALGASAFNAAQAADAVINDLNDVTSGLPFPLLGNGVAPISYVRPLGDNTPVLTVRPGAPLFCARRPGAVSENSDVVIDVNGYNASFSLAGVSYNVGERSAIHEAGALFRAADRIPVEGAMYDNQFVLTVNDVDGYCWLGLAEEYTGNPAYAQCADAGEGVTDVLHRAGFDGQGTVHLSTTLMAAIPPAGGGEGSVYYRHVLTAEGGRVDGIQLREQFPYYYQGTATFRDSLALSSAWQCQPGAGAYCGSTAGGGYMALDGVSLEAGSCLVVVSGRAWRQQAGATQDLISGRINAAAHAPGANGTPVTSQTSVQFSN